MFKLFFISAVLTCGSVFAQITSGTISGTVTDKGSGEKLPYVNMVLLKDSSGIQMSLAISDLDGNFSFKGIQPGLYALKAVYIGCQPFILAKVKVNEGKNTSADIKLTQQSLKLCEVVVYTQPVIYHNAEMSYHKVSVVNSFKRNIFSLKGSRKKSQEFRSNTEQYNRISENEFRSVASEPLSTMSIDVDRASYSNVRRFITRGSLPPADAVRVEEMINYFNYHYPQPEGEVPFSINTEYTECPWNKNHNIVHVGIQGKEMKTDKRPASNFVFLVDVSGSMQEEDKLPLVKSGLRLLVAQLKSEDKISLVAYAGAAGLVLPATSGAKKEEILKAIDNLEAGGSTAGGEGIELAYKTAKDNFLPDANNRVILATDGDFNVGVSSEGELVHLIEKKRNDGIYLTVLGFGTGNYRDNMMEQLADKGNGNYSYIDNINEAKKVLEKEMSATLHTIAKDVKVQVEFNPAKVKAYRLVGYENRVLNNEDFNDDTKDAGELGAGHTVTAIYEIIPATSSETVSSVDELRYQKTVRSQKTVSNELMTVKFRYKLPKESKSKLLKEIVLDKRKPFEQSSDNTKFSSAVVEFGMLLRDSKFKGQIDFKSVITLANQSKGADEEGYRNEFIRLVEKAEVLKN